MTTRARLGLGAFACWTLALLAACGGGEVALCGQGGSVSVNIGQCEGVPKAVDEALVSRQSPAARPKDETFAPRHSRGSGNP